MKKKLLRKIILVVLAIALSMAFFLWVQRGRQGELDGPYKVAYVIDGETIAVDAGEEYALHVRLIGIDAPESASHDESQNTSEGAIASDYMKALLLDK